MSTTMEHLLNTAPHGGHPDAEEGHEVMPAAQALALSDLHETGVAASDDVPLLGNVNPLHRVKAQLTVCVGTATITVGELMAAKAQQVLRLDSKVAHPVDLLLEETWWPGAISSRWTSTLACESRNCRSISSYKEAVSVRCMSCSNSPPPRPGAPVVSIGYALCCCARSP